MGLSAASLLIIFRMYVSFRSSNPPFFPNEALTEASSIAIWDRNKFVVTIATIVWVASLVAIIQGKLFPFLPSTDDRGYHINVILY